MWLRMRQKKKTHDFSAVVDRIVIVLYKRFDCMRSDLSFLVFP